MKFCLISCLLLANGMTGEVMASEEKAEEVKAEEVMASDTLKQTEQTDVTSPEDSLTRYDRRIIRYRKHWDVLMPTQSVIQTCGNMGIISVGIGWDYGKRRQWRRDLGKGWQFEPLECTLYLNTVLGHDFWTKQPTKYESGYYPFSTRVRPNLGFGERFTYKIPNNRRKRVKSITMFYELSTNDIYFMRFYRNGNANFWDVFGLSFGAKLQIL